jgi:hypothetical protein
MSVDIRKELEKLSIEIEGLKKVSTKRASPEIRLKRYQALLNRISKSSEVDITPDELISSIRRKEY